MDYQEPWSTGLALGKAMQRLRVSNPMVKQQVDLEAYDFLRGILYTLDFDNEALYNSVSFSGNIVWAPVKDDLTRIDFTQGDAKQQTWSLLHETGHSLQEGIHSVFVKGGLSTETDEKCHLLANCLLRITPD